MSATLARPYDVPQSGFSARAIALAVLMHLLLGALLFFGIRWQSSTPAVIQAELWSATPQTAAPAPRPVPPPPKVEMPKPEPKAEEEPPKVKPDIVEKAPVKIEPPKKKEPRVVEPRVEAPKPQPKPEPVKTPPKPAVEAPPRAPSELAALQASAAAESTGKDQQTSGPRGRENYISRLQNAIKSQMRYPANSPGNPVVTIRIEQLPNGEVTDVTINKSSGIAAFDEAVERAIRAASPLPKDDQGKVERVLKLDYNMYDKS